MFSIDICVKIKYLPNLTESTEGELCLCHFVSCDLYVHQLRNVVFGFTYLIYGGVAPISFGLYVRPKTFQFWGV